MSAPPPDPKEALRKQLTSAVVWTVLSAALAVFMFVYSNKVDPAKKNFYLLAGAVAAIAAAINGYNGWLVYQKTKTPPQ
jgi:hypothetical protein